jgi:hypothetical protein
MSKAERFPLTVREQSVVVKIYRERAKSNQAGFAYKVSWITGDGVKRKTFADLKEAKDEAALKASHLAAGLSEAKQQTRSDVLELTEARSMVEATGVPLLSALAEWVKARELAGPGVLEACAEWNKRRTSSLTRIKVEKAVDDFIAAKNSANKKGSRTYESKLKPIKTSFADRYLDSISVQEWTKYLAQFDDAVTRNDHRKRAITLCRWAQRHSYLADAVTPDIERTERAKEKANPIGILKPAEYAKLLEFFQAKHPHHLAALVLAGLCGLRSDEIHGKWGSRERRQLWEDIHLDRGFMSVTVAKENTPSNRIVHLSDAALAWLRVCPGQKEGPVCQPKAMERVRDIAQTAGFELPENCFRHSWITFRIALTGNKPDTATEAGNSVREIDRRYRVPRPKFEGEEWFATRPMPVSMPSGVRAA